MKNLRIIALAILAAATFWFLNALNGTYSTTLNYPINFLYDHDKYIPLEELPKDVQINVSGVGWNLFRNSLGIKITPVNFRLDNASDIKKIPGSSLLGTLSDQLDEFQVNFVLTDTLYIKVDKRMTKTFKLAIDSASIALADNFWVTSPIRYSPDSVTLQGPESILTSFSDEIVVKIPQSAIDENYKEDIPIEFDNSRLITREPPTMNVVFNVEEFRNAEIVVPIFKENFPKNGRADISTSQVKVSYQVVKSKAEAVLSDEFEVVANYNKINPEDSTITFNLKKFPEYIKQVSLDTTAVKVNFNK
ncbi:MAG TPA: hypothetical protein PKL31_08490 [Fulvivirga sp.]|nr:hypothetical protein [Fulvivirga sp.]